MFIFTHSPHEISQSGSLFVTNSSKRAQAEKWHPIIRQGGKATTGVPESF